MAKAGYCSECKKNVYLTADSHCQFGHAPGCISNVYNAEEPKKTPLLTPNNVKVFLVAIGVVVALIICSSVSSGNNSSEDTSPESATSDANQQYTEPAVTPPFLSLSQPTSSSTTSQNQVQVAGTTDKNCTLTVNGQPSTVNSDGSFSSTVTLVSGSNSIQITSTDTDGHVASKYIAITYNPPPPPTYEAPAAQQEVEATVYTTRTGECYHRGGCRYLKYSSYETTVSEAQSQGYRP